MQHFTGTVDPAECRLTGPGARWRHPRQRHCGDRQPKLPVYSSTIRRSDADLKKSTELGPMLSSKDRIAAVLLSKLLTLLVYG